MQSIIGFNTISKQFTKRANSIQKLEFDINAAAAATVYVQVHDFPTPADLAAGNTAPANASVPLKSWPVPAGATQNYKEFKNGEFQFKYGCFVCVSTTQATLTIGTGNNKFDSVAVELWNVDLSGTNEVQGTDIGTNIWTNGTTHQLIRGAFTNLEAGVRYLMLFATGAVDLPANGDTPLMQWTLQATGDANATKQVDFTSPELMSGYQVFAQTSAHASMTGCAFVLSTTAGTYTTSVGAGMNYYVEYK